jgi:sugar lactone lactonase YvrE
MHERLYVRLLWAAVISTLACGSSPGPSPAPAPMPPGGETTGGTGGTTSPIAPPADAAPASELGDGPAAPAPPDAAAAPVSAPDGGAAPLGPFPLEALRAARPSLYVAAATHLEGPSWRNGELFFAADGDGWGLMRVDAGRKLYRYHPGLTPIGTTLLGDGSLLACDHKYFLVQVFPDGKVGVLPHAGIDEAFCNDVAVDGTGNIFVTARRAGSIFRITPAGEVTRVAGGLDAPNGVEIDPQNRWLYFGGGAGGAGKVQRIALPASGTTFGPPEMVGKAGQPDGMAFDAWGNLWVAAWSSSQVIIFAPDKTVLTTLPVGGVINLTFGGKDGDTLFIEEDNKGVFQLGPIPTLRGFLHPGAPHYTLAQMLDLSPTNQPH